VRPLIVDEIASFSQSVHKIWMLESKRFCRQNGEGRTATDNVRDVLYIIEGSAHKTRQLSKLKAISKGKVVYIFRTSLIFPISYEK